MTWNWWTRQVHRWVSIAFTAVSAAIFIALAFGQRPAQWVYYLPLFPLALLVLTGLYMFALPYIAKRPGHLVGAQRQRKGIHG